ncbi:ADP-ribosylation factor-binding protein GGA3-like isoform X2 [Rhopilema esculentum]|uniref:ADP-ribosylation factor-binding protein GGA3-like isoform X2 n=1 Tax=Rhopilema esculentum TaxID=499914 RepID=UPI0031DAE174
MAETLEDILEKATNPKNFGDNTTFANVFAEQINKEFDGPARAVKLISHKLSLHQEVVTLQTLTVLEVCVKNCGQRFHQEIGKYRFLNELIKLLSPKYDGGITSQAVKDRVAEIMYNLYVGLPSEMKIAEAYRMLKQQGVIKRDPVSDDATQRPANRPSNTALDDEEKSKLLAMLLKSKNPEDLQAANKLIKTMVKQEEERLEKFSKRVQELETVSNNVDLLNEMIDAYSPSMSESDQVVMRDLYEACLSMRTQLFRIASQCVEDKDDTLSEILALSDDLTKAIDKYKRVVIQGEQITESTDASSENVQPSIENSNQPQNSVDSLLDIGLGFDDQPPTNASRQQTSSTSFLDEQFKMLGLDDGIPTSSINTINSQASAGYEWGAFGSASALPPQTAVPQQGQFYPNNQFNANLGNMGSIAPMMPSGNMVLKNYSMPQSQQIRPTNTTSGGAAQNKGTTGVTRAPANDLLGFDVFADFKKEDVKRTKEVDEAKNVDTKKATQAGSLLDLDDDNHVQNNLHSKKPEEKIEETKTESLSAVGGYFVPLEAIEPLSHTPINVLDKDGLKIILNIVKDKREEANPNVIVVVFSTISTNVVSISEYKVEVSVPKAMKIKLQPPSTTALPPFNPLLPPSAITQIMLIANPSKEAIHLKIRISYKAGSNNKTEIVTLDSFPVT